ncbi:MAG: polysaccharide pyruvyl transferase family protein [Thermosipho sp. (in: Bacteria)]|nr:polysaccharide pyruvyl transferase family protein [Thermosipho sp. (in: thermotogales)]
MKILLIAVVGTDNFGDEAMFKYIYNKLKSKNYQITVGTYNVKKAKERFPNVDFLELPKLSRKDIIKGIFGKTFVDIILYDALYVSGAGALNSMYFPHVFLLWNLTKKFRKNGKYVEFRPQSVGPFFGKTKGITRKMVNDIVRLSDKFFVREKISYDYLKSKGFNVVLKKDDAWNIDAEEINLNFGDCVGISIRPWRNKDSREMIKYFKELEKIIKSFGYNILFIPIAYGGSKKYIDNSFLKGNVDGYFLENYINLKEATPEIIKGVIKKCKFTIGMSYHFNVFSLSLNKRAAAVYSDEYYKIKNLGLYKAWGNSSGVFKIPETPPKQIIEYLLGD